MIIFLKVIPIPIFEINAIPLLEFNMIFIMIPLLEFNIIVINTKLLLEFIMIAITITFLEI